MSDLHDWTDSERQLLEEVAREQAHKRWLRERRKAQWGAVRTVAGWIVAVTMAIGVIAEHVGRFYKWLMNT